jgi:hypothetical protein
MKNDWSEFTYIVISMWYNTTLKKNKQTNKQNKQTMKQLQALIHLLIISINSVKQIEIVIN